MRSSRSPVGGRGGLWRALAATALLLPALSCGPKVVVARMATPTAGASVPTDPPTPRPKQRTGAPTPPSSPTPTPEARPFPAPRWSATVTATATVIRPALSLTATATATAAPPESSPTATVTAASRAAPSPTATATATARPARPVPPETATATPPPADSPTPLPYRSPAAAPSGSPPASITGAPAGPFAGEWVFRADAGAGTIAGTLRFRQTPEGLAGVYVGMRGNATELSNLRTVGNRIAFDLVAPRAVWHLEGALSGDSIDGTFQTAERTIRWTAAREPAP